MSDTTEPTRSIWSYHEDGTDYINEELERKVADAIRRYPVSDAPQWLGPVAAIRTVWDWMYETPTEKRP